MKTKQLQIVTLEQAKRLRELGFVWETDRYYALITDYHNQWEEGEIYKNSCINDTPDVACAPTVSLALKWFRDEKGFHSAVSFSDERIQVYTGRYQVPRIVKVNDWEILYPRTTYEAHHWHSYEAAESALLDNLLAILENGKTI
jgi:hypothetical protein